MHKEAYHYLSGTKKRETLPVKKSAWANKTFNHFPFKNVNFEEKARRKGSANTTLRGGEDGAPELITVKLVERQQWRTTWGVNGGWSGD